MTALADDLTPGDLSTALLVLQAAATEDLHRLSDGEALDRCRDLTVVINRAQAEMARVVAHADVTQACEHDGNGSMRSWLRGHTHHSPAAASAVVTPGRAMEHLPVVAEAFTEGRVSPAQVAVVAAAVTPARVAAAAAQEIDLDVFDRAFCEVATTLPFGKLAQAVQAYLNALEPDGPEPDPTDERSLTLSQRADGGVLGRLALDAVGGEILQAALESIVQADRPEGDTRTRAQQQADALVQLCANQLSAGTLPVTRTVKPHVAVTIDLGDLADPATGHDAATTGFGATLSAARARWLTCDATITRIVLGPDGLPLDVGRSQRVVPTRIRRAVEQRDGHCVFAGCHAPTHWCEVHHLVHWIAGGETSLDNSALLCERHHTKIHHGFRVERDDGAPPGSRWTTYRPDGSVICTERLRI